MWEMRWTRWFWLTWKMLVHLFEYGLQIVSSILCWQWGLDSTNTNSKFPFCIVSTCSDHRLFHTLPQTILLNKVQIQISSLIGRKPSNSKRVFKLGILFYISGGNPTAGEDIKCISQANRNQTILGEIRHFIMFWPQNNSILKRKFQNKIKKLAFYIQWPFQ